MNYKIAVIRGDGIGPEVVNEAVQSVMEGGGPKSSATASPMRMCCMGGCATDAVGQELPRRHRRAVQGL